MQVTAYHAKLYANEIACRNSGNSAVDSLSQSLFDAKVDLNPHQIEAALFALKNPLQQGVMLADEVGLGKTIEAALVLCQYWAERQRNLLITCPAVLSKQWQTELGDKFALPSLVVDRLVIKKSGLSPAEFFRRNAGSFILIMSHQFAAKMETALIANQWHLVVIDEAHKFRNAHKKSNQLGQTLRRAFQGCRKLLLTATPLQNSLMELYGLSTLLDEYLFGDEKQFRRQFVRQQDLDELRLRLKTFVKRTLRKNVSEYVHYTKRKPVTQAFTPTDAEQSLYEQISAFLQEESLFALPKRSRHLMILVLRKLLASSPQAILDTLNKILLRLQKIQENRPLAEDDDDDLVEELGSDYLEFLDNDDEESEKQQAEQAQLAKEIAQIQQFIAQAKSLKTDRKALALLDALNVGFKQMQQFGANQKAIIFTESVRTQAYLVEFLSQHGYADQIVAFSGTNSHKAASDIYEKWKAENAGSERITGSIEIDKRTALIDHFRNQAKIMIATEAAAEGINLQFCSLLINYDLPWNPQRLEQRIGRCHRYGQEHDVVVINFLNERNAVDKRVLQLLQEKFNLFNGVFGASDEILGKIESGVDIERKILAIYQSCRTASEIQAAFDALQKELDEQIQATLRDTQQQLFDSFDQDVLEKLKIAATDRLNKMQQWVWRLTQFMLADFAKFDEKNYRFWLKRSPANVPCKLGEYHLLQRKQKGISDLMQQGITYRLTQPLGEFCLTQSLRLDTPYRTLTFYYQPQKEGKLSLVAQQLGKSGWLRVDKISIHSEIQQLQETLIFTACTDQKQCLDADFCRQLFSLLSEQQTSTQAIPIILEQTANIRIESEINRFREMNKQLIIEQEERLNKWAEDSVKALEEELTQLKSEISQLKRQSRQAQSLEEKCQLQLEISQREKTLRLARRNLFDKEDEISEQRDNLIDDVNEKLAQHTQKVCLFQIRWHVI
ncbi:SNF2-related protein [Necropsobacter rosorum]|uniref:SNF2-related protein n=1 Tax=Necropsobacter rosorum TaxID=908285 RepID=UPI000A643F6D